MDKPNSIEELNRRIQQNQYVTGFGVGNVHQHMSCPFCGAPEFCTFEILEMKTVLGRDNVCAECERGVIAKFSEEENSIEMRLFQTRGPDLPDWYEPKFPRYV